MADNKGQFIKGDARCWTDATPGSFQPGYDIRRVKKPESLAQMMRERTGRAVEVIDYILNAPFDDKSVSMNLRRQCAELVLNRGWGMVQSQEQVNQLITPESVKRLSLDELARIAGQEVAEQ